MAKKNSEPSRPMTRRKFLSDLAAVSTGAVAGTVGLPAWAQQKSSKTGTVRVWGEPGPYGGVAVDAMNEWAKKFAPGLTFKLETLSWDSVYVKLMTDLAARNPAHCISVDMHMVVHIPLLQTCVPVHVLPHMPQLLVF